MILEILIVILYLVLSVVGLVLFLLISLILLPIVISVDASRNAQPDATPQIQARVGLWFGALAVAVEQIVDGWEARLLLLGRFCVYRHALVKSPDLQASPSPIPGPSPSPIRTPGADPVTRADGAPDTPEPATNVADVPLTQAAAAETMATPPMSEPVVAQVATTDVAPVVSEDEKSESEDVPPGLWQRIQDGWRDVQHFLPPTRRLLRRLLGMVGLKHIHVEATIGLEDAAQTGLLYGRVQAVRPFLPSWAHVWIEADFTRPASHGRASVRLHLYLARLVAAVFRFAIHAGWLWLMRWWRLRRVARTMSPAATT
ncbi:MAG: DUF2953 domain-containing protein [Gemmatimonadetes bacterium]|nr:DUF2953 domain-containing protein [Gemmatimonadota bacterium]MBT6147951.1 DUF2953 domain-containing protein [Gemmatimonadota bacterium]MBT7860778.1 DUF2953 domain-containing protein [Gemmatimonadota bacterium]